MTDSHPALKNGARYRKNKGSSEILMGPVESIPFSNLEYRTMIIVRVTVADYSSVTDKSVFTKILVSINTIVTATGQLHESSYLN